MLYSDSVNGDILSALEEYPLLTKKVNKNVQEKIKIEEEKKLKEELMKIPGVESVESEDKNIHHPENYTNIAVDYLLKEPIIGVNTAITKNPLIIPVVIITDMITQKFNKEIENIKNEILDYSVNKIGNVKPKKGGMKILNKTLEQLKIFLY